MRDFSDRALAVSLRGLLLAIGSLPPGVARESCASLASIYARLGGARIEIARINAAVEEAIREAPEQWNWSHRRFKTQPAGVTPVYPSRASPLRRLRHLMRGGVRGGRTDPGSSNPDKAEAQCSAPERM